MRAAFPRYLVPTRAADPYQQARCDATPETETRHATRPLTGKAVTGTRDQAGAPDIRAPAPVTCGLGARTARSLLPRRAARRAKSALPGAARSNRTGSAQAATRGDRLRRIAGLLQRGHKARTSYYDPLFERPDLIEDDFYRLRNQPCS